MSAHVFGESAGSILPDEPYATYLKWRSTGPLCWREEFFGGAWVLTTYEGVQAALRDPRFSARRTGGWVMNTAPRGSAEREELLGLQRVFSRAMLFVDKPAHPRLRQAMQSGFRPAAIHSLQPFITSVIEELLDEIDHATAPGESFDFIAHFARHVPARVIARLLGLENTHNEQFIEWSAGIARFLGSARPTLEETRRAQTCLLAVSAYFERTLASGEYRERDDLLGVLARAAAAGEIEEGAELLAQCAMLLFAGYETTRHLLGTSIYWVLRKPGAWEQLQSDPTLVRGAVRELLRWDGPIQYTGRRVKTDVSLYGQTLRRGDLVLALIGAANRDPAEYEAPDELRLNRQVGMPLSFGVGVHACIGANLTLSEAEVTLGAILRRWPALRLAEEKPGWIQSPLYRGLVTLPLVARG